MLRDFLFLASAMSVVVACTLNTNRTDCEAAISFDCTNKCSLYHSQNSCKAIPGCTWMVDDYQGIPYALCWDLNSTYCSSSSENATVCEANPMCTWWQRPCIFVNFCRSRNASIGKCVYNDPNCTDDPNCEWRPDCGVEGHCFGENQTSCVAEAGCFWSELTREDGQSINKCSECFTDFTHTENAFSSVQARVGRTCGLSSNTSISLTVHKAVAAATGCSGGGAPSFGVSIFSVCNPPLDSPATTNELSASFVMISSIVMLLLAHVD